MSRGGVSFSVGRDHRDRDRCDQPPCSMQRPTPLHRRPSLPPSLSLSLPRPPFYSAPLPPLPAREGPRTCTTPTTTPSPSFTGHVIAKSIPNANRAFPRGSNSSLVPFFERSLFFEGIGGGPRGYRRGILGREDGKLTKRRRERGRGTKRRRLVSGLAALGGNSSRLAIKHGWADG